MSEPARPLRTLFLRHGESRSNAAVGMVSLPEEEGDMLSERGAEQARAAAEHVAGLGISRIVTSSMGRAVATAEPIAAATGLEPEFWDWIHELQEPPGYYSMSGPEQQRHRWSRRMQAHAEDPTHSPGGGESFADLLGRVERTRERLVADDVDRTLVVGHGIFLRFTFALTVLGDMFTPHLIDRLWRIGSLNCGLSTFDHLPDGGGANPAEIAGWRCVSWMSPIPGAEVTGTGGDGPGN